MSLYNVASLYIQCDIMPVSYNAFEVTNAFVKESILHNIENNQFLNIHLSSIPYEFSKSSLVATLNRVEIWHIDHDAFSWMYIEKTFNSVMYVSEDYANAAFWFPYDAPWSSKTEYGKVLFQLLVECRLVHDGYSILHASCVSINYAAFALSGDSGIGKSTRAKLWIENLGAECISGDKPIVHADACKVYGAPWDGKEKIYKNIGVPLKAILEIVRSEKNTSVCDMTYVEKLTFLSKQLLIPMWDATLSQKAIIQMNSIIKNIPVYKLECNYTKESMNYAYEILLKE